MIEMRTSAKLKSGEIVVDDDEDDHPNYGYGWDVWNDPEFGLVLFHSGSWTGYFSWYERFIDADKVLVFLRCRSSDDARACDAFYNGMRAIARARNPRLFGPSRRSRSKTPTNRSGKASVEI